MEICYLWVNEFRNFTNEGFIFTSEYKFNYSIESNVLNIQKNQRYIEHFFIENVKNITGIIGKNGAGKTNLLELINYSLNEGNTKISNPFFIIFKDEKQLVGYYHGIEKPKSSEVNFSEYSGEIIEVTPVFFSNSFDGRNHDLPKRTIELTTNSFLENDFKENIHRSYQKDIVNQLKFVGGKFFKFFIESDKILNPMSDGESELPKKIKLISPTWGNILARVRDFEKEINITYKTDGAFIDFVTNYRKRITASKNDYDLTSFLGFLTMLDFLLNEFRLMKPKNAEEFKAFYKKEKKIKETVKSEYDLFRFSDYTLNSLEEINEYFFNEFPQIIDEFFPYQFERSKFLFELKEYEIQSVRKDEGKNSNRKIHFESAFDQKITRLINKYFEVNTNQNLAINMDWVGISSGHKAFINLFGRFSGLISNNKVKQNNMLICIDEGDLYFHPKWQGEFLFKIQYVLSKMFDGKNIQIILTTHSPFLVSDLPKDNLLFLEKKSAISCSVISNDNLKFETFGGNILDLYINSFFLKGHTISSFAAEKLKGLINSIQENHKLDQNQQRILDIVGDDLIKHKLNNLINDDSDTRNNKY